MFDGITEIVNLKDKTTLGILCHPLYASGKVTSTFIQVVDIANRQGNGMSVSDRFTEVVQGNFQQFIGKTGMS